MQEGTLTLLLDMAERGRAEIAAAAAKPLRSAEEIAREMVPDAGWLQLGTSGVRLASDVSVPHARAIVAAAIERDRAERQPAQPRDIAGRIRALIQEYAGRWADSARLPESRHLRVEACMHAMRWLWHTLRRMETGSAFPEDRITELRKHTSDDIVAKTMRGLADELDAIVRECAPSDGT